MLVDSGTITGECVEGEIRDPIHPISVRFYANNVVEFGRVAPSGLLRASVCASVDRAGLVWVSWGGIIECFV